MPAGWAFDNVLKLTAAELRASDESLAAVLMKCRTEVSGGYCDLRGLTPREFRMLVDATERAYARVEAEGPKSFHDRSLYSGFLETFRQLQSLMHSDPRAKEETS